MTGASVAALLRSARYRWANERDLQDGLEMVLRAASVPYTREAQLSPTDRVDLLVGTVAIEVKVSGSRVAVARQLGRYADHDEVTELVLVSTRAQLRPSPTISGKPVHFVRILAL